METIEDSESLMICVHCKSWDWLEYLYGLCLKHDYRTSCSDGCEDYEKKEK